MTYLRRMLVPKEKAATVLNYLKANVTPNVMSTEVNIGGRMYYAIKFVSATPVVVQDEPILIARKATKPSITSIIKNIFASDRDLPDTSIVVDATDYANANNNVAGAYDITVTVSDPDGVTKTLEYRITVTDATIAVITLTATAVDVANTPAATYDFASNIASALDDGDDVSASVVITYKKTNAEGDDLADVAAARTWLSTTGNSVFAMYNYTDASGNVAVEKTATFTGIDD